jgi:hypothetical protein
VDFSSDFSGKMEEFVQNGRCYYKPWSQQSTMWPIRYPATVYFFRESWPTVDFKKKNPTTVDSWSIFKKKSRNSRFIVKSRLSTSRLVTTWPAPPSNPEAICGTSRYLFSTRSD